MSEIVNPLKILFGLFSNRVLINQLAKREITSRYKGTYLGVIWSYLYPLLMLSVYTFVFSEIFQSRWSSGVNNKVEFAMVLFCGLTTFNVFSEVLTKSPTLITQNVNYVKKVVFPLEVLPVVSVLASLFNALISYIILIVGLYFFLGVLNWTIIFTPIVLMPLIIVTAGLSWFLASLGVFIRDMGQLLVILMQALMLLSPIFYPPTAIPESFRFLLNFNPLSYVIENMRKIMIWGELPNWQYLLTGTLISVIIFVCGYAWFQKTKVGFADVL
ncbi:ABC transporter permease [Paenibacillus puerhi]|uniref:ABC transporter permease n=1 Tax=Paenibacillus puerhi TaxID=2692622 RepID=UPI00135CA475|nr:ABC transporter permease [Paenibacillus puerhi]